MRVHAVCRLRTTVCGMIPDLYRLPGSSYSYEIVLCLHWNRREIAVPDTTVRTVGGTQQQWNACATTIGW